ncbi:MAG: MarR family transcriptional regulator [Oscillibacter sp.]|nr:MarR family transcriptional regulator [Oscillibacter sp.]MBQ2996751.1 MarR family transcriptional regulator [Oscillibacter sp.]
MDCQNYWGPLLGENAHLARERLGARLTRLGMTPAQTHALLYLGQQGGSAPQTELTEFMRLKAPTVNGILGRMEEKELLLRLTDRQDGRRKLVVLTEKGKSLLEQTRQAFAEAEDVMRRGFTQAEAAQLQGLLERLRQNLKEDRDLW